MKKPIRIITMIALIVLVAACLTSCDKKQKGPTIVQDDPVVVAPTYNTNKSDILQMISDGMLKARADIDESATKYVYSNYMVLTGDINYTVTFEANYREKKQESEIYLKIFDNYEHANRIFAYYNKGTLYLESMYGKQRLDNFGTSASFDLFYSVATILDASPLLFSNEAAAIFDPNNKELPISMLIDQERITYIAVSDTASSIEMTDINLNYGQIKNVINNAIKDTFSPFERKLDLLTMKYLGMRLSYLAGLEISTANGDLLNARMEGDRLDTVIVNASGIMADAINTFKLSMTVTTRPGYGEIELDDFENPYLDSAYEPMLLGHYNYAGILALPILDDLEFDATLRAILSSTDNTINQVVLTLDKAASGENAGGVYYKDQILYADISGIQEFLGDCVEMNKMNLPKVNFTGFNLAQELTLLINKVIKFVDATKGKDLYGENKEMLNTVLEHIESDEPTSTISIRITQELLELFNDGNQIDFATWIAKTLGLRPELVKQVLGNRTMENMSVLLTYNVDKGTIGVYVYDGDYLALYLILDKIDDLGVDELPYPSHFKTYEYDNLVFPENTILEMNGKINMQEVQSVRFDELFGTLMGDITGLNTPYLMKSSEQLDFVLQLMQEYEYTELPDGSLEQKTFQTLRLEISKKNVLQLGVYSCNSNDPDPVKKAEEESYLLVNFNVAIGPEGVTKDGYNYEKRILKYRVKRDKVVDACNKLLGEDNIFATTNVMDLFSMITSALKGSTSMKMRFTENGFTFNLHKEPIKELIGVDNLNAVVSAKIKFAMRDEEKLRLTVNKNLYALPKISGTRIDATETTKLESQTAESIYTAKWQEYAFVYFNEERINPMRLKLSFTERSTKIESGQYLYSPKAALLGDTVTYDLRILDRENGTRLIASLINPNTPSNASNLINAVQTWYIDPSMVNSLPETIPVVYLDGVRGEVLYEIDGFDASNINLAGFNTARYTIVIGRGSVAETKIIVSIGVLNRVIIPLNQESSYPEGAPVVAEVVIDPYTYAVRKMDNAAWSPFPSVVTLKFEALPPKSKEYVDYLHEIYQEAIDSFLPLPEKATEEEKAKRTNDIYIKAWILAFERTITPEDLKLQMETKIASYDENIESRHRAWPELLSDLDDAVLREKNTPNTADLNDPQWDFDFNNIKFNGGMFFTHAYFNNVKIAMKVYVKNKVISHMKLVDIININIANEENRPYTEANGIYTVDLLDKASYTFPVNSTSKQEFRVFFSDGTYRIIGTAEHQSSDSLYYNNYLPILLDWACPEVVIKREAGTIEPLGREYKATNTAVIGGNYSIGEQTLEMTVFEPARTQARVGYSNVVNAATGYGRDVNNDYDFDIVTMTAVQPTRAAFSSWATYGSYFSLNPYNIQPLPKTVYIEVEQGDRGRTQRKGYPVVWQEDDIVKRNEDGTYSIRNISLEERLLRVKGQIGNGDIILEVVMIVQSLSAQYKSITFNGLGKDVTTIAVDPYAGFSLPDGFTLTLSSDDTVPSSDISWFISIGDMSTLERNKWMLQFYGRNYSWMYDYLRYKSGVDRTHTLAEIIPAGFSAPSDTEYETFLEYLNNGEIPITNDYVFPYTGGDFVLHSYVEESERYVAQIVQLNIHVLPRTLVVSSEGDGSTRIAIFSDDDTSVESYNIDTYQAVSTTFLNRLNEISLLMREKETILDPLMIYLNEARRVNDAETDPEKKLNEQDLYSNIYEYLRVTLITDSTDRRALEKSYSDNNNNPVLTILEYINDMNKKIQKANVMLFFGDVATTVNNGYRLFVYWTNIQDLIRVLKSQNGDVQGFKLTGYIGYGEANMQKVVVPVYVKERAIAKLSFTFDRLSEPTETYNKLTTDSDTYTIEYDYSYLKDHVTELETYVLFNSEISADRKYEDLFRTILSHPRITEIEKNFLQEAYTAAFSENIYLSENEACQIAVEALKQYRGEKASLLRSTLSATLQDYSIAEKYTHVYNVIYNHSTTQDYEKRILDLIFASASSLSGEEKYESVINTYMMNRAEKSGTIFVDISKPFTFRQEDTLGNSFFIDPKEYFIKAFSVLNLTFADRTENKYSPIFSLSDEFTEYILTTSEDAQRDKVPDFEVEGKYYSNYVVTINNLSLGSCINPISILFRSVVDTCGGLSGTPTAEELEPFDEFGDIKYSVIEEVEGSNETREVGGFKLPEKLVVNYDFSGPVTFGNINNWKLSSPLLTMREDDPISVIPATAINIINAESDIRVHCELPCSQGTYNYSIDFPNKYIGETRYTGTALDRNYSMLDITNGRMTIDDYYTIYKSDGTTAQNILAKMPATIKALPYDFHEGVEYVAGRDVIPSTYEATINNNYNPRWTLLAEWANGEYVIDKNGMTSRVLQSGSGYDFKTEHKLFETVYDSVQDKDVSQFTGYVLFATADISSYYYSSESEADINKKMKPLVQKIKVYIKVREMLDPVVTYEGLLDLNDDNFIQFDPYNTAYDYNGNLTLPTNNVKVYFNGSTTDNYHIFNGAGSLSNSEKLMYYLMMEDTDITVKSVLFRNLLDSDSIFSTEERLSFYPLYFDSLSKQFADKLGITVDAARQQLYAYAYEVLLEDGNLLVADQLKQREFLSEYSVSILNGTYAGDGFNYVNGYDAVYAAYSTQQSKKRAVFSAYLRTLSTETPAFLIEVISLLADTYTVLSSQLATSPSTMLDMADMIYAQLTEAEKTSLFFLLCEEAQFSQIMLDAFTAAMAENPAADEADAMDIAFTMLSTSLKSELITRIAAINPLVETLHGLNSNYSKSYISNGVAILLFGKYLDDTLLDFVARALDTSAFTWDNVDATLENSVKMLKEHVFVAYLKASIKTASLANEVLNIYFGVGTKSISRYKEIIVTNILRNYTFDDALYRKYYGTTVGLATKYSVFKSVRSQMEYDLRYTGLMTQEEWRIVEARADAWNILVPTMEESSTLVRRLYTLSNEDTVKKAAYEKIMSDAAFASLRPYILNRLAFVGISPEGITDENKINTISFLMGDSSTLAISQKAFLLTALRIIKDGITETERLVSSIAYTQAGHAESEISNNILTVKLVLPDGQVVTLKVEIFSRIIEKVLVESIVTDAEEVESTVELPNVYYIDPYNSNTLKLPTSAKFVFEADTLELSITEWTSYDSNIFYSTGNGVYYYRNTENSYEGGSFVLQSNLSYGHGSSVSRQYFEILVVVLNRKLNIDYNDEYTFDNPVTGRVSDIPVSLESSMFVNSEDYYDDEIDAFFAQYEINHGVRIDPETVYYSLFGVPVLPEIYWYKTEHNPGGINDVDIDITGNFNKSAEGYISTENTRLISDYTAIYNKNKKMFESSVKPLAWEMLFDKGASGDKIVKTVFSGAAKDLIERFELDMIQSIIIDAYKRIIQESDTAKKEQINTLMVIFRNNAIGITYPESDTMWYVEFYNDLKAKSERNALSEVEETVYSRFNDKIAVLKSTNLSAMQIEAWDELVTSVLLTKHQKDECAKYIDKQYEVYESDIAIYCYDELIKILNEQEVAAMSRVMSELQVIYGTTVSGIAKAKQAAFTYLRNYYLNSVGYVWGEKATIHISAKKWTLKNLYERFDEMMQTELESVLYNIYQQNSTYETYQALFEVATSFFADGASSKIPYTEITDFEEFKMAAIEAFKAYLAEQAVVEYSAIEQKLNGGPTNDYTKKSRFYDNIITEIRSAIQLTVDTVKDSIRAQHPEYGEDTVVRETWNHLKNTAIGEWSVWFQNNSDIETYAGALDNYINSRTAIETTYVTDAFMSVYREDFAVSAWEEIVSGYSASTHSSYLKNNTPDEILYRNTLQNAWQILWMNFATSDQQSALGSAQSMTTATAYSKRYLAFERNYPAGSTALTSKGTLTMHTAVTMVKNYFNGYAEAFDMLMANPSLVGETAAGVDRLYKAIYNEYSFVGEQCVEYIVEPLFVTRFLSTSYASEVMTIIDDFTDELKYSAWGYVVSCNCTEEEYDEETDSNNGNVGFVYDDDQSFKTQYGNRSFLGLDIGEMISRIKAAAFDLLKEKAVQDGEYSEFIDALSAFFDAKLEEIEAKALENIVVDPSVSDLNTNSFDSVTVSILWDEISDIIDDNNFIAYSEIINGMSSEQIFNIYNMYYFGRYNSVVSSVELVELLVGNAPREEKRALMDAISIETILANIPSLDNEIKLALYRCYTTPEAYLYSYLRDNGINVNFVLSEDLLNVLVNYLATNASDTCKAEIEELLYPYTVDGAKATLWNRIYNEEDSDGKLLMSTVLESIDQESRTLTEAWDCFMLRSYVTDAEKARFEATLETYRKAIMFRKQLVLQKDEKVAEMRENDINVRDIFKYYFVYEAVLAAADEDHRTLLLDLTTAVEANVPSTYTESANALIMRRFLALRVYAGLATIDEIQTVCSGAYEHLYADLDMVSVLEKSDIELALQNTTINAISMDKKQASDKILWEKYCSIAMNAGVPQSNLNSILTESGGNYSTAVTSLCTGSMLDENTKQSLNSDRKEAYEVIVDSETLVFLYEHYLSNEWDLDAQNLRYRQLYCDDVGQTIDNYYYYPEVIMYYLDAAKIAIDQAFDTAIASAKASLLNDMNIEFWNEYFADASAERKEILDDILLNSCSDPDTMRTVVALDEKRNSIIAEISSKIDDIYEENEANIRKEQAVISLFGNDITTLPDARNVIDNYLKKAIELIGDDYGLSHDNVLELKSMPYAESLKVLAWNYALTYYLQASNDYSRLNGLYDDEMNAHSGEVENEWQRNSWRTLQSLTDRSDYLLSKIDEVKERYNDGYSYSFDNERWKKLMELVQSDANIYDRLIEVSVQQRGENPGATEMELQVLFYDNIPSIYADVKANVLMNAGAIIGFALLQNNMVSDDFLYVLQCQHDILSVSKDELTAMNDITYLLIELSADLISLRTSTYATTEMLRVAIFDTVKQSFTGAARRVLDVIEEGVDLAEAGYTTESLLEKTYDTLYANLVPGKKIILGNIKDTGLANPGEGDYTPISKSAALALYKEYLMSIALAELTETFPEGITDYAELSDVEKVEIFRKLNEPLLRVLTCYTESAAGDDTEKGRLVVYWADGLFHGDMDTQIASVHVGNNTKRDTTFEIPNVNYIKRQILITNLDFYGSLSDEDGNDISLDRTYYNQYVIDPLKCVLDENCRTTAIAYGKIGVSGAENTYLGSVVVEFDSTVKDFTYDGRYTRTVYATVYSEDMAGEQILPIEVTYLDRRPEEYYVPVSNFTQESMNTTTKLYSLSSTSDGAFYVRIDPTDEELYDKDKKTFLLPTSMAIVFNQDYGTDTLAKALSEAGLITERMDISKIGWNLLGNTIGFAGVDYKSIALSSYTTNGVEYTVDVRMDATFWNLLLYVPNRRVNKVDALTSTAAGSKGTALAALQNDTLVSINKVDPYNYDIFFPTNVVVTFEEKMAGDIYGDRGTKELFNVEWTFSETRGLNYLKDPDVITGRIGENGMYITASFTYLSETIWVTYPIKARYIDISEEGSDIVHLRDGGTIYLIKGMDAQAQLMKYDALYYNFGTLNEEDWTRVPLSFVTTDLTQISTESVGIYTGIRGRLGEINDPNVSFTVMVVDPKLYAMNSIENGTIRPDCCYDRLTVGVSSYGNRVIGKEENSKFFAGFLTQMDLVDDHGIILANRKDFTIKEIKWDVAGKQALFTCEYEFMTEYNDYTYLCHHTYLDENNLLVKVNTLEFTVAIPLDVYEYSTLDNSLTLNMENDDAVIEWELGKPLNLSDLPTASMGPGSDPVTLLWDLSTVNVNKAGVYDMYGYFRGSTSAEPISKHLELRIAKVDISDGISSMYIESASEVYSGLEISFVPVIIEVLRESGDIGSLEIGPQIVVDYILASKYDSIGKEQWCSDTYEAQIVGYNNTTVYVEYDTCNPFAALDEQFGNISEIQVNDTHSTEEYIKAPFNDLSDYFERFISNFEKNTDTGKYEVTDMELAIEQYKTFFASAKKNFSTSYLSFAQRAEYEMDDSVVVGINYSLAAPGKLFKAEQDTPEEDDSSFSGTAEAYQMIVAKLFGFNDTTAFMQAATKVVDSYNGYRTTPTVGENPLLNGCFYTNNKYFVFPFAIKNELSPVLVYLFVETNGHISVWISDMEAALSAIDYDEKHHTEKVIHNELYCKRLLYFNDNQIVDNMFRPTPYTDAGNYYARVRIVDYNVTGEKLFPFSILPVEISSDDISFSFGADSQKNEVIINGWPSTLEEKNRMEKNAYRAIIDEGENIRVTDGGYAVETSVFAKAYAYNALYEKCKSDNSEEPVLGFTLLTTYFNMLWKYYYYDTVESAELSAAGRTRIKIIQAQVWDLISPTGMKELDLSEKSWVWTSSSKETKDKLIDRAREEVTAPEGENVTDEELSEYEDDVILEAYEILKKEVFGQYDRILTALYDFYLNKIPEYSTATPAGKKLYEERSKLKVWAAIKGNGIVAICYADDYPMTDAEKDEYEKAARDSFEEMDAISEKEVLSKAYDLLFEKAENAVTTIIDKEYKKILNNSEYGVITDENRKAEMEMEAKASIWKRLGGFCIYGPDDNSTDDDIMIAKGWPIMKDTDSSFYEKESILDEGYDQIVEVEVNVDLAVLEKRAQERAFDVLYEEVRTSAQEKLMLLLNVYKDEHYADLENKTQDEMVAIDKDAKAGLWAELDVDNNYTLEYTYVYDGKTHLPTISGMPRALIQNWPTTVEEKTALLDEAKSENSAYTDTQAKAKAFDNLYQRVINNAGALNRLDNSKEEVLRSFYSEYFLLTTSAEEKKRLEEEAKAKVWDTLPVGADAAVEEVTYFFKYQYTDMSGVESESTSKPVNAGSYDVIVTLAEGTRNYIIKAGDTIQMPMSIVKSNISQNFVNEMIYTGEIIRPIAPELFIVTTPEREVTADPNADLYDDVFNTYALPDGVTVTYSFYQGGKALSSIRDVGEYYFSAVVDGGNNYPSWSLDNQVFSITPRKLLIEVGNVSGNYLEELKPLNSAVTFKGRSEVDNIGSFGEVVCESDVTSRHIVGDYDINFVGFGNDNIIYYMNPVVGQKSVYQLNAQIFGNYDITILNGTYTINKATPAAIMIYTPEELQSQYNSLTEGSSAVWYLAGNNYGDLLINKNVNLTIIGCYDVNTIGASDGISDPFEKMRVSAASIDVVFSNIVIKKGSVSLDIVRFERERNNSSVEIGRDAGYVEIKRSGFLPPVGSTDVGVLNAMAINVLSGYSKRLSLNNTYIEGYTSGVNMNYLDLKNSGQENKLEVIDCLMSKNQNAIYALNGRMDINGCKIEYTTGVAIYLSMQSGFSISGCEFIGNEICIQSGTIYQEDLRTDNTFIDNVTEVAALAD